MNIAPAKARAIRRDITANCEEMSATLRTLAHPLRLRVLCELLDGERTVTELISGCGDCSQPAMSQLLSRMREEGAVSARKDGTRVFYRFTDLKLKRLLESLRQIYC